MYVAEDSEVNVLRKLENLNRHSYQSHLGRFKAGQHFECCSQILFDMLGLQTHPFRSQLFQSV
jgi:hypothetical protein